MSELYDPTAWSRIPAYGDFLQKRASNGDITCAPLLLQYMMMLKAGNALLDVACGAGTLAFFLEQEKVPVKYTGIDITPCYLEMAKKRFPQHTWVEGDARKLPFEDKQFDDTICINLLQHLPISDVPKVLKEMTRVTKDSVYIQAEFAANDSVETVRSQFIEENGTASEFYYNATSYDRLEIKGWTWYRLADRLYKASEKNWPYKNTPYSRALVDMLVGYLVSRENQYVVLERMW